MVVESSEIMLRVRIETFIEELCDRVSLDLERSCGDVHEVVESLHEIVHVGCEVSDPRDVDGNNADGTCGLTGTEEAA